MKRKSTKQVKNDKGVSNTIKVKKKNDSRGLSSSFLLTALISALASVIISYLLVPETSVLLKINLSKEIFILISIILSIAVFFAFHPNKLYYNISKYLLFFVFLSLLIIDFLPINDIDLIKLISLRNFTAIPFAFLGAAHVWISRKKLNDTIASFFSKENINKTGLKEKLKNIKLFSFASKNSLYTIAFAIVISASIYTMFHKLDYFDLWSDEAQVTEGAAGYYFTGEFKQWNFIKDKTDEKNYRRAYPHLFLVAQSYKVFGMNPWAGRFVSAFFGICLIVIAYFIANFFIRNKLASILIIFSFAFYFEYLLLFRWTRMYAVLIPIFLLMFYFAFRFLSEKNKLRLFNQNSLLNEYFNFNYILLIPFALLLIFSYLLHLNALIILPVMLLYSLAGFLILKEKKYITIFLLGLIIFFVALNIPQFSRFTDRFTFFETDNSQIYAYFTAGYPLNLYVNSALLFIGLFMFFLIKNNEFRKRFLFLYLTGFISLLLFSYILNYSVSFRYMSLVSPPSIILIVGIFIYFIKILFNKVLQSVLIVVLLLSVLNSYANHYNDLYVENFASPAKPSKVYPEIADRIKPGELLMMHWGPRYYLDDIDNTIKTVKLGSYKPVEFSKIYQKFNHAPAYWLTWHTQYKFGVDEALQKYAEKYFVKYHGYGIDSTFVELFYADSSMIKDTSMFFNRDRFIPTANINMNKSYTVSFFSEFPKAGSFIPLYFTFKDTVHYYVEYDEVDHSILFKKENDVIVKTDFSKPDQIQHIVLSLNHNGKVQLFAGRNSSSGIISEIEREFLKMQVNIEFLARFDNLRLYAGILDEYEREQLKLARESALKEIENKDGQEIKALFKWNKN
jgi:hypothetical protein